MARSAISIHNISDDSDPVLASAADGTFAIRRMKPGSYEITATHEGFMSATQSFELSTGEDRETAFALQPVAAPATNVCGWPRWE